MFKRVEKRRRKQERDEEIGLDAETKAILGMHNTDSDESSSGSEDSSEEEQGGGVEDKGDDDEDVENEGSEHDSDREGVDDATLDDGSESSDTEGPPVPITEALRNPLYSVSLDSKIKGCVACPGKLLKNPTMCEVHRSANAHVRRYKRFVELASKVGPAGDVRDILSQINVPTETKKEGDEPSNRAKKRQAKLAKIREKREKQKLLKAKGIARKNKKASEASIALGESTGAQSLPPSKKRKLESGPKERVVDAVSAPPLQKKSKELTPEPTQLPDKAGENHRSIQTESTISIPQSAPARPIDTVKLKSTEATQEASTVSTGPAQQKFALKVKAGKPRDNTITKAKRQLVTKASSRSEEKKRKRPIKDAS